MTIRDATKLMFLRYKNINSDYMVLCKPVKNEIEGLIDEGILKSETLPIDKLNRWLGYVQHYLINLNLISIEGERDFSRPLFHEAYKTENVSIPESIEIKI